MTPWRKRLSAPACILLVALCAPAAQADQAEFLQVAERVEASRDPYLGRRQVEDLETKLAAAPPGSGAVIGLHGQLSFEYLRLGEMEQAGAHLDQMLELGKAFGKPTLKAHELQMMVELRRAEIANCIERHHRECCLFPLSGGGVHSQQGPARRARRSLLAILEQKPQHLGSQWLLNLTSMAIGDFPHGVPEPYRLPPGSLESEAEIGRFVDVAPELGLDAFNLCGGAIVEDFDGDGYLDIVTSTSDPRGHLILYHNRGDGSFSETSGASGLQGQLGGLNCISADYDNDGDADILVLRGAWMGEHGQIRNSLLRNEGGVPPRFSDVTREAGLASPAMPTQAAVFGDFDLDGDLDLFVGNESGGAGKDYPSQLFRNQGDGTFVDIAGEAGVENHRLAKGVTAGDFDNDGDLDLYVSNIGENRLYRNDSGRGAGAEIRFTDVARELGVQAPAGRSFAPWFFDYNNDGWLDLFVAAYDAGNGNLMRDYRGQPHACTPPALYLNRGGRFENVTAEVGLDHAYLPMGASFGDIDYDGFLDIYLATGNPSYQALMPNVMLRNDRGRRFQNVTTSGGFGHLQKGHGICFADLDNDGDQDLYHQLGGFYPGDKFHNALFLNPGGGGHHLVVELEGRKANRNAVGARVELEVITTDGFRKIHRAIGSVSSFGGSPLSRCEIGLGHAESIQSLKVTWPGADGPVTFEGLSLDQTIRVIEGEPEPVTIQRERLDFLPRERSTRD